MAAVADKRVFKTQMNGNLLGSAEKTPQGLEIPLQNID